MRIELKGVEKRFGEKRVLNELSLAFEHGERVLVRGANGAGKSTLLRILSGLSTADKGEVIWWHEGERISSPRIAYTCHDPLVYDGLTVEENIDFFRVLIGESHSRSDLLQMWNLTDRRLSEVRTLSQGERCRVGLCRAFLGYPQALVLDEPTASLDDPSTELLLGYLSKMPQLSVVSTHDPKRFTEWATRVITLESGSVLSDTAVTHSAGMNS